MSVCVCVRVCALSATEPAFYTDRRQHEHPVPTHCPPREHVNEKRQVTTSPSRPTAELRPCR